MDFFFTVMQAIPWNKISLVAIKFYLKILSTSADLKGQIVWTTKTINYYWLLNPGTSRVAKVKKKKEYSSKWLIWLVSREGIPVSGT